MEHKQRLIYLFERYLDGNYTQQDVDALLDYFGPVESDEELRLLIEQAMEQEVDFTAMDFKIDKVSEAAFGNIQRYIEPSRSFRYWPKIGIAAAAAMLAVLFIYLYNNETIVVDQRATLADLCDVEPGGNKAILKTANGQLFQLDGSDGGIVVKDNAIQYLDGRSLIESEKVQEFKLRTPKGGTYNIQLSDGSKVWLNADSEIQYPSRFAVGERRVKVHGEAYFEVKRNTAQPFIVESAGQVIHVLGTSFNIRSYSNDKQSITTLLEGSVALSIVATGQTVNLKPNEQARVTKDHLQVLQTRSEDAVAWKDGLFRFEATTLYDALKQMQRWYDLDIDFDQVPTNVKVHAVIDRDKKLSSVLYAIEQVSNVKFKLTGRRLEIVK